MSRWLTTSVYYARLVYGRDEAGFTADCFDLAGAPVAVIDAIRIVGSNGLRTLTSGSIKTAAASDAQALAGERLDRNIRWLGEEGQMRLCRTHLVICGLGGIGSALVANASGLGFRRLTLVDPDRVEPSNLNRLFGAVRKDVGQQKVEVMARQLKRIDPETEVYTVAKPLNDAAAREAIIILKTRGADRSSVATMRVDPGVRPCGRSVRRRAFPSTSATPPSLEGWLSAERVARG